MIYLCLPVLQDDLTFNNKFTLRTSSEYLFKIKELNVNSCYGAFPFFTLNGEVNLNSRNNKFLLESDIYNFFNSIQIPFRLSCTNLFINNLDLQNNYFNLILSYGHDKGNFIEINNLLVLDFIKQKYPNYYFIYSNPFIDITLLNKLIENEDLQLIELPSYLDFSILNNIKQKNKIELRICNKCPSSCNNFQSCINQEHSYQNTYFETSIYSDCLKINSYNNSNEIQQEIDKFQAMGYTHFKVDTPPCNKLKQFKQYLIHNLLSEDKILTFTKEFFTDD